MQPKADGARGYSPKGSKFDINGNYEPLSRKVQRHLLHSDGEPPFLTQYTLHCLYKLLVQIGIHSREIKCPASRFLATLHTRWYFLQPVLTHVEEARLITDRWSFWQMAPVIVGRMKYFVESNEACFLELTAQIGKLDVDLGLNLHFVLVEKLGCFGANEHVPIEDRLPLWQGRGINSGWSWQTSTASFGWFSLRHTVGRSHSLSVRQWHFGIVKDGLVYRRWAVNANNGSIEMVMAMWRKY
jgi:hypothetical protein